MPQSAERASPIVCVKVMGGLGNQMFCAAAGLALAHRISGARLEFDVRQYERQTLRAYELGIFKLPAAIHRAEQEPGKGAWARLTGRKPKANSAPPGWTSRVWHQQGFHYDPSFRSLEGSVYATGYFQSAKYFEDAAPLVRHSFDLRDHLSPAGRQIIDAAQGDDTVAVHVRRGDYVSNTKTALVHAALDAGYYHRAIALMMRVVATPRLFVVSDDESAARELLRDWPPNTTFVRGTTHLDDMHLISSCRHRVIANSSFSWWGAWLDDRPDGVTVAPRAWFSREHMMKTFVDDLYPSGWILT